MSDAYTNGVLTLGSDDCGIRFTLTHLDHYVDSDVTIEIDVWNGPDSEAAHTTLDAAAALELAQWIDWELGR